MSGLTCMALTVTADSRQDHVPLLRGWVISGLPGGLKFAEQMPVIVNTRLEMSCALSLCLNHQRG